ncbi:MAG: histidine kinase [Chloroflexi bacterium]|nr:histidine kinase [Chloroflexota bacterium]
MHQTIVRHAACEIVAPRGDDRLECRLRDGVLQDIVAISMLIVGARQALHQGGDPREIDAMLARAQHAAEDDADKLRSMIDELRAAA